MYVPTAITSRYLGEKVPFSALLSAIVSVTFFCLQEILIIILRERFGPDKRHFGPGEVVR